jgi:hypothetical protein
VVRDLVLIVSGTILVAAGVVMRREDRST